MFLHLHIQVTLSEHEFEWMSLFQRLIIRNTSRSTYLQLDNTSKKFCKIVDLNLNHSSSIKTWWIKPEVIS